MKRSSSQTVVGRGVLSVQERTSNRSVDLHNTTGFSVRNVANNITSGAKEVSKMSVHQVKEYHWRCEYCGKRATTKGAFKEHPKGWETVEVHDCGLTGYTREDDVCSSCLKKQLKGKKGRNRS